MKLFFKGAKKRKKRKEEENKFLEHCEIFEIF